jgi:hypothetical protein
MSTFLVVVVDKPSTGNSSTESYPASI